MKHFEATGLWYLDEPDKSIGGTLRFDRDGLQLSLLGALSQGWSPMTERYPMIRGVVSESPHGVYVSLIDAFTNKTKFNMAGVRAETIRCHKATIGNCYLPEGTFEFKSLELDYSYLTQWVGRGGMEVERRLSQEKTYVATYRKPEDVEIPFGDKKLILGFNFNATESTHRTTLTETARLLIEPFGEATSETLGKEYVRTLQDLITFATDRPNGVEEIAYRAESDEQGVTPKLNLIFDPIFRVDEKENSLHAVDMLFTYGDTKIQGINIFQKWLDFSLKHKEFCEVYFGHTYAKPKYLDDRFRKMMVAFTLLCSTLGEKPERTRLFQEALESALQAYFSAGEREFLGHLIPTWSEIEMPIMLHRMLEEYSRQMGRVIEDIPSFVRSISDTLVFVERRVIGTRPPLDGGDLFYAVEKIKMLIKIIVLKELGFAPEAIDALVARNKHLAHLGRV